MSDETEKTRGAEHTEVEGTEIEKTERSDDTKETEGQKVSEEQRKRFFGDRRKPLILAILSVVLLALLGSFAWYVISSRRDIVSEDQDVMVPYFLYLKNATDENSLVFSVGNMHPGETKQVVICVTNEIPQDADADAFNYEIGRESRFAYEMQLAYTENLPINYTVYDLEETDIGDIRVLYEDNGTPSVKSFRKLRASAAMTADDQTAASRADVFGVSTDLSDVVNKGKYESYTLGGADGTEQLVLTTSMNGSEVLYEKDFYLIQISWKDGIDFSRYKKETDLVDVIVRALQPRPSVNET
ncbi:MAG: hypothetical protein IJ567_06745 [Lachnospiraceae bacterium]|nr:hypothetical protein [Lachnospiraceae bacterium]